MESLQDFVTTKYNIILASIRGQQVEQSVLDVASDTMQASNTGGTSTSTTTPSRTTPSRTTPSRTMPSAGSRGASNPGNRGGSRGY